MIKWLSILLFCLSVVNAKAGAPKDGASGSVVSSCPYPVDGGCGGANQNSNFKDASLFAKARQSGQRWTSEHPMNFNVPGQDYPVGYDKTLTLKDPQTAKLPPQCSFDAAKSRVLCNSSGDITINGFDFTGAISAIGHPISLQFGPNTTGTCTVTNNKFSVDVPTGDLATWFMNGTCGRVYKFNECRGTGAAGMLSGCIEDDSLWTSNTLDVEYNAFPSQSGARLIIASGAGGNGATWKFDYNYVQGLGQAPGGPHGEVDLYGGQCRGCGYTIRSKTWNNNFIVWDKAATSQNNATFFAGTGDLNNYKTLATNINSNVIVTNRNRTSVGRGTQSVGHALVDGQWANLGVVTANNNYLDPTGAAECSRNGLAVQNDVAFVTGNTATISKGSVNAEVGHFINGPGMRQAIVTAVSGAMPGQVVTFDGPPQSLGSINVSFVPGMKSLASSGNKNLTDGTSVDLSYPLFTPRACNNSAQ
jgi:hypothetical protein